MSNVMGATGKQCQGIIETRLWVISHRKFKECNTGTHLPSAITAGVKIPQKDRHLEQQKVGETTKLGVAK